MTQKEIEKILTSGHYEIVSIEPFGSFVALAPNDRIFLFSVITGIENLNEQIQRDIRQLCAIRNAFIRVISETLENIKVTLSMVIVCNNDIKIINKTEQLLHMNNVLFIRYDGNSKTVYDIFPKIKIDKAKRDDMKSYRDYIETTISYIRRFPDECFRDTYNHHSPIGETNCNSEIQIFSSPRALANEIKKYVKGQDNVIDRIAVPFFQHIESMRTKTSCEIKTSFILAGGTGTGKSEILRRFCQLSGVPIIRINTADCTPASWRGQHISDHISYYVEDITDIEKLRYAVLVFNEFDKITHYNQKQVGQNSSDWDADMQREFLRFYDKGYELMIEKQGTLGGNEKYRLPTDNLLLCYDGAFSGIEKLIQKRLNKETRIGFTTPSQLYKDKEYISELAVEDLERWGYLPELLGRIGSFYVMNPMSEDLIYEIITTASENILDAHKVQCSQHGITLTFKKEALRYIAQQAMSSNLGFRAVKTILSRIMQPIYFDCDKHYGQELIVDKHFIEQRGI